MAVRLPPLRNTLLVAAGGAVGALARAGLGVVLPAAEVGWPWPTFVANLSGAVLLGFLLSVLGHVTTPRWWIRPLVATGVIGGYTTFSTLSVETLELAIGARWSLALAYAVLSAIGGLVAAWTGSTAAVALRRDQR